MVFHAVAGAFDDDGLGVVEESVENGGGQGGVVVEDAGSLLEGAVGGEQDGAAFEAGTDDLEEQIGALFVDGQVAEFVEDQQGRSDIFPEFLPQALRGLGGNEGVDHVDGGDPPHGMAGQAGLPSEGRGDVAFADADATEQDDVGMGKKGSEYEGMP